MKLKALSDFVIERYESNPGIYFNSVCHDIYIYAQFLKRPLELSMLIPCDEDGNVLDQPCDILNTDGCRDCECREYKKAKEKVLFQGITLIDIIKYKDDTIWILEHKDYPHEQNSLKTNRNVESLLQEHWDFTLTKSAIKQLDL